MDKSVGIDGIDPSENRKAKVETSVKLLSPKADTSEEASLGTRVSQTAVMYSAFLSLGIVAAIFGPTLPDLETITRVDTDTIAWVLTSRSIGSLVGVIIMGAILSKANPWLLMGLAHAINAMTLIIAPLFKNIVVVCCIIALNGIGRGFVDGACNVMILVVWGAANGPWLQGLHFINSIGSLLGPMLAAPFLTEHHMHLEITNVTSNRNATDVTPSPSIYTAVDTNTSERSNKPSSMIHFYTDPSLRIFTAYSIAGVISSISYIAMFILFCLRNRFPSITKSTTQSNSKGTSDTGPDILKKRTIFQNIRLRLFHWEMLFLGALFNGVLYMVPFNYGSFIFSFAVNYLGWSNNAAVSVTSAYWGTFICARGMAVFISRGLKPGQFLLLCILLGLLSTVPMLFFVQSHPAVFWAGTIGFGLAVSPMFALSMSLMGLYIRISGPEGAVILVAVMLGEMMGSVLIGILLRQYGYISLIYFIVAVMLALLVIGGLIYLLGRTRKGEQCETLHPIAAEEKPLDEVLEKYPCPDKV